MATPVDKPEASGAPMRRLRRDTAESEASLTPADSSLDGSESFGSEEDFDSGSDDGASDENSGTGDGGDGGGGRRTTPNNNESVRRTRQRQRQQLREEDQERCQLAALREELLEVSGRLQREVETIKHALMQRPTVDLTCFTDDQPIVEKYGLAQVGQLEE